MSANKQEANGSYEPVYNVPVNNAPVPVANDPVHVRGLWAQPVIPVQDPNAQRNNGMSTAERICFAKFGIK